MYDGSRERERERDLVPEVGFFFLKLIECNLLPSAEKSESCKTFHLTMSMNDQDNMLHLRSSGGHLSIIICTILVYQEFRMLDMLFVHYGIRL